MKKTFLSLLILISTTCFVAHGAQRQFTMTFTQLQRRCLRYPEHSEHPPKSFLTRETLLQTTRRCTAVNNLSLRTEHAWIDTTSPFKSAVPEFAPFVQKLIINPQSTVFFFGDLHGNVHSLIRSMDYLRKQQIIDSNFRIIKPNTYLIFLGDYVDRGNYGIEVIYTLMRLRMTNPRTVLLIRGNHEDIHLNSRYGFAEELYERARCKTTDLKALQQWYTTMPLAVFIGVNNGTTTDFIQCCHGGPELGFNAAPLLEATEHKRFYAISELRRADNVRDLPMTLKHDVLKYVPQYEIENSTPTSPTSPVTIGLMWSDVIEDPQNYPSAIVAYNKGRGWVHGKNLTGYWLTQQSSSQHKVHGIIRGHQHYGRMLQQLIAGNGLVNLWDGMVYTVLSAPSPGTEFPYDAFTMLKTGSNYSNWSIQSVVIN